MKHSIFIGILLILTIANIDISLAEQCAKENCLIREKCEEINNDGVCPNSGDVCCGIVRLEYQNKCRHFGGECMIKCNTSLQKSAATDCQNGTICCVLV